MQIVVSIIIVNWNGEKWLDKCLSSLRTQTFQNFEIILVDNHSEDTSVSLVEKKFPEVFIIKNKQNDGFAGGNNIGFKYAKGEYIFLLNNDTWLESDCLEKLLCAFNEIPNLGSVQAKLVLMGEPEKLDVCGSYWTSSSLLYHYGFAKNQIEKAYNTPMPFFSNKGAAMMIPKTVIDQIGLFDADFWCYYEETDFCHRAWIAGYECWYYPLAVVHHAVGGTSTFFDNSYVQFHSMKNKLMSYLKNFEISELFKVIPIFIAQLIGMSIYWLIQGKLKHFLSVYKSIFWNLSHFRKTMGKRQLISNFRVKSDVMIFQQTKKNPSLKYYYYLLTGMLEQYEKKL